MTLTHREKLSIVWQLLWPGLALSLPLAVFQGKLPPDVRTVIGLLAILAVQPWIVHRVIRYPFADFRLAILRGDSGEPSQAATYREALSVAWLLHWRAALVYYIFGLCAVLAWLYGRWTPPAGEPWNALAAIGGCLLSAALLYWWLIPAALRKRYAGFRLAYLPLYPRQTYSSANGSV
jgi:hypothetical protein